MVLYIMLNSNLVTREVQLYSSMRPSRLELDQSMYILTRPVVIIGFNKSLLVDW